MPDVTFRCPACENPVAADMSFCGTLVVCPHCTANIPVPGQHQTVAAPVPPPTSKGRQDNSRGIRNLGLGIFLIFVWFSFPIALVGILIAIVAPLLTTGHRD